MELADFLPWVAGAVGVPAVNFLKGQLGWSGRQAAILSFVVAAVLGVVSVLFFGEFDFANLEQWLAVGSQAITAATVIYKLLPQS